MEKNNEEWESRHRTVWTFFQNMKRIPGVVSRRRKLSTTFPRIRRISRKPSSLLAFNLGQELDRRPERIRYRNYSVVNSINSYTFEIILTNELF